jgi:O-antigen/teichoic acid export membrane protein
MKALRRVISNTVISLLGQVVTWGSTLLLTIAYGRFLGDIRFGELYFAITFVALFGFPLEFGFNQQLTRNVAQKPEHAVRYLTNTLFLKGWLWLTLYTLMLVLGWLLGYSSEQRTLIEICGLTLLCTGITNTFASLHYAAQRVVFSVIGTILEKGLGALAGFFLLKAGASVEVMAFVLLGGSFINAAWQAIWFFSLEGLRLSLDRALMRSLILTAIPFLVYGVLGVIYYRIDTILLSLMTNTAVISWYGASYRLFDTLVFLPSLVINAIMYPVFSRLSLTSEANLKLAVEKTLNFLLFSGLPIATFMIVAAPGIIGLLYHNADFLPSIPVLQALAPGLVFLYANSVLSAVLISVGQEKKISYMAAAALVFNLGLNLLLIPLYKHVGAAIVTSLTELLLLSISTALVPRHLLPTGSIWVALKALVACAAMGMAIWLMQPFPLFVIIPVATLEYLMMALALAVIPGEDMRALARAVRKKARPALAFSTETLDAHVSAALAAEDAFGAFQLAIQLHGQNRLIDAWLLYQSVVKQDPEHFSAHYNLGLIYSELDLFAAAEEYCRKAAALNPESAEAQGLLTYVLQRLGALEEAEQRARLAVNMGFQVKLLDTLMVPGLGLTTPLHRVDNSTRITEPMRRIEASPSTSQPLPKIRANHRAASGGY